MTVNSEYLKNGALVVRGLFGADELQALHRVLVDFHAAWKQDNVDFYAKGAVNSAYITGPKYLNTEQRSELFRFIGGSKIAEVLATVLPQRPAFLNTQLFFDPANPAQNNYWHRDPQYHLSVEQQKQALHNTNVIHFRIPLKPERGLELVPATHRRWDTDEEFDVRMQQNGKQSCDDLSTGTTIELAPGDLLVFSANMIHRGLYGLDRLAFDILFFEANPELVEHMHSDCLPDQATLATLDNPAVFLQTIQLKAASTP